MQHSPYHFCNSWRRAGRLVALLSLATLGCSSDQVELGGRDAEPEVPPEPACGDGTVNHDVNTYEQADIDALTGCTEIQGRLWISGFPDMDLSPLASLRRVRDTLYVGITDRGGDVPSLHGLEALEHVGGLSISRLLESDLTGLRSLRSVRVLDRNQGFGYTGMIELNSCQALTDLRGLESLEDWSTFNINGADALESLNGLVPPGTAGSFSVTSAPRLRDVSALGTGRSLERLRLQATGIENLDGLDLAVLGSLELVQNPALVQLDGLNGIISLGYLSLDNNHALQRLPELPGLKVMRTLQVTDCSLLEVIPAYSVQPVGGALIGSGGVKGPPASFDLFVVGHNAKLRSISALRGFTNGHFMAVYDNPNLIALDLGGVADVDQLIIRGNPTLADVDVDSLEIVKKLEVVGNPALPLARFDGVAVAVSELSATTPP
jgi:hypothetical protein